MLWKAALDFKHLEILIAAYFSLTEAWFTLVYNLDNVMPFLEFSAKRSIEIPGMSGI